MRLALLAIGAAALVCAGLAIVLQMAVLSGIPVDALLISTAASTLILAAVASGFAYRAFMRANAIAAELQRLTRAMDQAIKDFSTRNDRDAAMLVETNAFVARELDALAARVSRGKESAPAELPPEPPTPAVASQPSSKRSSPAQPSGIPLPVASDGAGLGPAIQRVLASGRAELSLQPIISVAHGVAGGFEVYFHIQADNGQTVDVRRMQRPLAGIDTAAFERLAVASAIEAARRQFGKTGETMPLHVAISGALLLSETEFSTVLDLFRQYPSVARSVVLSIPADATEPGQQREGLDVLAALGLRFATEGWPETPDALDAMRRNGVAFFKLPADRLLGRSRTRKSVASATALIEMAGAANIQVIATDVRNDEDAVALLDLGIDLMAGERFSGPRRLKPEAGDNRTGAAGQ